MRQRRHVQQRIGVQLQSQALWPELTVDETLKLFQPFPPPPSPSHPPGALLARRKARALVKGLSGGQKQRLSIATALVNDPDLVFLDEPTTGLDPQARHSFWDLIRDMKGEGKTLIITTHYMEEAEALCDRVAVMDHGRIIALDTPRQLIRTSDLREHDRVHVPRACARRRIAGRAAGRARRRTRRTARPSIFTNDVSATLDALVRFADRESHPIGNLNVRTSRWRMCSCRLTGRRLRD